MSAERVAEYYKERLARWAWQQVVHHGAPACVLDNVTRWNRSRSTPQQYKAYACRVRRRVRWLAARGHTGPLADLAAL